MQFPLPLVSLRKWAMRLVLLFSLSFLLLLGQPQLQSLPVSVPRCHSVAPRDRYCEYQDVCVSSGLGVFVLGASPPSSALRPVNLVASTEEDDVWYTPRFIPRVIFQRDHLLEWVNRTLVIASSYSPQHLTHFLVNNILPAIDLRRRILASREPPMAGTTLTASFDLLLPFSARPALPADWWGFTHTLIGPDWTRHPLLHENRTICYPQGVFGLNSTCPFRYCEHQHEPGLYREVRDLLWEYCRLDPAAVSQEAPALHIIQRQTSRRVDNLPELEALLRESGITRFKVFELEDLDFCQQARVFFEAEVVMAVHGNSLGHLLWMRNSTRIIELNSLDWGSPFFSDIVPQLDITLFFDQVFCRSTSCALQDELDREVQSKNRSLKIDPVVWEAILEKLRLHPALIDHQP